MIHQATALRTRALGWFVVGDFLEAAGYSRQVGQLRGPSRSEVLLTVW